MLIAVTMHGIFPVLVNYGTQSIPPLMFAAITMLLAAAGFFVYVLLKGKLYELKNKKAYMSLIKVTIFISIIPSILFFIGASKTSGINSSMLLLSEIIFTLLFTPLIGEKTTIKKIIGAVGIFIGAVLISYNGKVSFNIGDVLVIASTITFPIGNFYAKKAFNLVSPEIVLFVRFFLSGFFILFLALLVEPQSDISAIISQHWELILFTGLVLLGIGKMIWYEGFKRLDISKSISLAMTFPIFSLIVLIFFFKEIPSTLQWVGILIMAIGVYFSIKRKSTDPTLTKYAPQHTTV